MKKVFCLILCLLCLCNGSFAEPFRVYDNADLFNEQEEQHIESKIDEFRQKNKIDFAVLTTDDFIAKGEQETIASLFYQSLDFGIGKDKDGAVFYIDSNEWYAVILPQGFFLADDVLGIDDLSNILDECMPYLAKDQFTNGILQGIDSLQLRIDEYWEEQLN